MSWKEKYIAFTLLICFACLFAGYAQAQNLPDGAHLLHIFPVETGFEQMPRLPGYPGKRCANAQEGHERLKKFIFTLRAEGYAGASLDSLASDSLQTWAYVYVGKEYKSLRLNVARVDEKTLSQIGYKPKRRGKQSFDFAQIRNLQEKLLEQSENTGYPFAGVSLQNVNFDETGVVTADLELDKGRKITIDSLIVKGNAKISNRYLRKYLNIAPGDLYNEAAIQKTSDRIRELAFLTENRKPSVTFIENEAKVYLYLKRKKSSKFDFLLGLVPETSVGSSAKPDDRRRYRITGEGQLHLQNAIGAGETMALEFKSYPGNAKELKSQLLYPYIPFVPLGADVRFELYIRDTLYRNVGGHIGLQYVFGGNDYAKVYTDLTSSAILSVDTLALKNSKQLPDVLDVKHNIYGWELNFERLDYRLNPRKGFAVNCNVGAGAKKVKTNNQILQAGEQIEGTDFESQYAALNENKLQFRLKYRLEGYLPIGKRGTLKGGFTGALLSKQNVLQNELYRIGGSKSLRGYNEEALLTRAYNMFTVEYRYLLGQNAYAGVFWDGALLAQNTGSLSTANQPNSSGLWQFLYGFGLGTSFETKAGVFGISYALGKQNCTNCNAIDFKTGKVHFGYVNYF